MESDQGSRGGAARASGAAARSFVHGSDRWRLRIDPRAIKAIIVFVALMGLFYAFVHTPDNATTAFRPYLALIARVVGRILGVLGYNISVADTTIYSPQFSMEIVRGCDAIEPIAIYLAAVLASPVGIGPRLPGIIVGTVALLLMNLVRIVSLFYVGIHYPSAFNMMHEGVWQAAFIVLAIVFWAVWVQWATRNERERPHAAPQETT